MSCSVCDATESKIYVGDIGTAIIVETCVDITTATTVELYVEKPDGTIVQWVGSVYETTKIKYLTKSGDLDQAGEYNVQPHVVMPSWDGRGNVDSFRVYEVFIVA